MNRLRARNIRTYSVHSPMTIQEAQLSILGMLAPYDGVVEPFGKHEIIVQAEPMVFEVFDSAIRFVLHDGRGCGCVACRCKGEIA